jgi:hypothetical protein
MSWLCKLPWTGFSNDPDGRVRPCCIYKGYITDELDQDYYVQTTSVKDIFSSKYMKDLREQFRNGQKPAGCETCIKDESNGVHSKRMSYTDFINYRQEPELPVEYQMILSNACNLKCRSCTPSHSNLWQAEHKILFGNTGYKMPNNQSGHQDSVLWNTRTEWMQYVERLEIVGGEPFYIKQWPELWQELVDQKYSKSVDMDMSTNCTVYGGHILEKFIPHFKRIGVGLSIDGIGPMYEYLRHPGKWVEVSTNILKYKHLSEAYPNNFGISYTHTIGWLNAWYVPEFHTWVKENTPEFKIWNNIIHSPRHMSLVMLPEEIKQQIKIKWGSYDWGEYKSAIDGIINFMFSEQPSMHEITTEYKKFILHDKHRNESILSVIPTELLVNLEKYFHE